MPATSLSENPFRHAAWRTYTPANGLASLYTDHVTQDRDGFLWFTTAGSGASRFDGETFHSYGPEDGLPGIAFTEKGLHNRTWAAHQQALQINHDKLTERMAWAKAQPGGPYMYAGGLDPVVKGADPEFSGRNAVMSSAITDGYWVFYEGPTYEGTHRDYFDWFTRANRAIRDGEWDFWRAPRQTPDTSGLTELQTETDRPQLVIHDNRPHLTTTIAALDLFEIHEIAGNSLSYLQGADVVLLQNFNEELDPDHPFVRALREYVENGGGLLIGHDTGWFMPNPFEEVAVRGYPEHNVEAGRHVINTDLVTEIVHPALGKIPAGTQFSTEFYDHMIFVPGPKGRVLIRNTFGDPVYVAGQVGKGRVVFSGCYYGYARPLENTEREVLHNVVRWLAGQE